MALVIPEGYYQATVPLRNANVLRPAVITFGLADPEPPVAPATFADQVLAVFEASIGTLLDPDVTIGPVVLTFDQAPGQRGSISGSDTATGSRASTNSTSPQIAAIFRKNTVRVGRPGRGRFYLPWCADRDDVQEDGLWDGATRSGMQAQADVFLLNLSEDAFTDMFVLHDETVPGSTSPSAVTSLIVDAQTGTQRRRNRS